MKRFFYFILTIGVSLSLLLTTSCHKDDAGKPEWPLMQKSSHTLIMYLIGTELDWAYNDNITATKNALCKLSSPGEALSAAVSKPRVLFFRHKDGDRSKGEIVELVYHRGQCAEKTLATISMPLSVSNEDMTSYLKMMMDLAPADSYGLIFGSHALGWVPIDAPGIKEVCVANNRKLDFGKLENIAKGNPSSFIGEGHHPNFDIPEGISNMFDIDDLASILTSTDVKFEYTIFDACLMANVEALYDLRHTSKYIIASVCEIMGKGFPYMTVVPKLLSEGGEYFDLDGVCRAYNTYYAEEVGYSGSISLIDCSEMEALADITKQVIATSSSDIIMPDIDSENEPTVTLQTYDGARLFYDFGQYINHICKDESQRAAFNAQLNRTVVSKYTLERFYSMIGWSSIYTINPDVYSGISTSLPSSLYRSYYVQTAWYKATH